MWVLLLAAVDEEQTDVGGMAIAKAARLYIVGLHLQRRRRIRRVPLSLHPSAHNG